MIRWVSILASYALLALVSVTGISAVDLGSALYNQGNVLYRDGDYSGAAEKYEAALATGIRHADVYFNLGNAHFKQGSLGRALLNYERARRFSPADGDILDNIRFANATKVDRFDLESDNAVTRFLSAAYRSVSPDGLTIWTSLAFLIACGFAGAAIFVDGRRVRWLILVAVSLAACGGGGALLAAKVGDLNVKEGIVLSVETVGRSGPGEDYLQVFVLHEGTKVVLERTEGLWGLVRLPNGIGGWIVLGAVDLI
jgi:tetratricopeptide (TPR) repeat protein